MDNVIIAAIIVVSGFFVLAAVIATSKRKRSVEEVEQLNHNQIMELLKKMNMKVDKLSSDNVELNEKMDEVAERNAIACQLAEINRITLFEIADNEGPDSD